MEKYNIPGWSGKFSDIALDVNEMRNYMGLPAEDAITFKSPMAEVFEWLGSVRNLEEGEESNAGADDSSWQNNEDPETGENSKRSIGTGTTSGDTSTNNEAATDEKIGGNEATGAGVAGGTGGGGTSSGS